MQERQIRPRSDVARAQRLHHYLLRLLVAAVPAQIVLAFLGIGLPVHAILGAIIGIVTALVGVTAIMARTSRATVTISTLLLILVALQPIFIGLSQSLPAFGDVHGVNALLILLVVVVLELHTEEEWSAARR